MKGLPGLIRKKRDGGTLDDEEIRYIIEGVTHGTIPDYQISALLMTIFYIGLTPPELATWTDAMLHSGRILDHPNVAGIKVDKHSTGGVGDKVSIPLAPAVAACGVPVPMMSGRGLGHTGGTLDKLESIPGFDVFLSADTSGRMLEQEGMFFTGQTNEVAPADKILYALRDVTGTVESIPLIASSIMSKKLAEGIDALVLDVKFGRGAFMNDMRQAYQLAETLRHIGQSANKRVHALLTDMNNPIGHMVGNSLEVMESIDILKGGGPADTRQLVLELGAHMLVLGKASSDVEEGRRRIATALDSGQALEKFVRVVEKQGGDPAVVDDISQLPRARHRHNILTHATGVVTAIDPMQVALAALDVGAGRFKQEDPIDHATGVELKVTLRDQVTPGQVVAVLHHNDSGQASAISRLDNAFSYGEHPPPATPFIAERLF